VPSHALSNASGYPVGQRLFPVTAKLSNQLGRGKGERTRHPRGLDPHQCSREKRAAVNLKRNPGGHTAWRVNSLVKRSVPTPRPAGQPFSTSRPILPPHIPSRRARTPGQKTPWFLDKTTCPVPQSRPTLPTHAPGPRRADPPRRISCRVLPVCSRAFSRAFPGETACPVPRVGPKSPSPKSRIRIASPLFRPALPPRPSASDGRGPA